MHANVLCVFALCRSCDNHRPAYRLQYKGIYTCSGAVCAADEYSISNSYWPLGTCKQPATRTRRTLVLRGTVRSSTNGSSGPLLLAPEPTLPCRLQRTGQATPTPQHMAGYSVTRKFRVGLFGFLKFGVLRIDTQNLSEIIKPDIWGIQNSSSCSGNPKLLDFNTLSWPVKKMMTIGQHV